MRETAESPALQALRDGVPPRRDDLEQLKVKELRDIARQHGVCLGYASRKADIAREIACQLGHRYRVYNRID